MIIFSVECVLHVVCRYVRGTFEECAYVCVLCFCLSVYLCMSVFVYMYMCMLEYLCERAYVFVYIHIKMIYMH